VSQKKTRIMFIEDKSGGLEGLARIGRVTFSKTGKSIEYQGAYSEARKALVSRQTISILKQAMTSGSPDHAKTVRIGCMGKLPCLTMLMTISPRSIGEQYGGFKKIVSNCRSQNTRYPQTLVTPAKAGVHHLNYRVAQRASYKTEWLEMDSRLRGNDEHGRKMIAFAPSHVERGVCRLMSEAN
jgi:hypothetical protein